MSADARELILKVMLSTPIAIKLPRGLPGKLYAICAGPVALVLRQDGQVASVEYLPRRPVYDKERRAAVLANAIWRKQRLFAGPALRAGIRTARGRWAPRRRTPARLYPFGQEIVVPCRWRWMVAPQGLVFTAGRSAELSMNRQWFKFNPNPQRAWQPLQFRQTHSCSGWLAEIPGLLAICLMGDGNVSADDRWLTAASPKSGVCALGLGLDAAAAWNAARDLLSRANALWLKNLRLYRQRAKHAVHWQIARDPWLAEMLNQIPLYSSSCVTPVSRTEAAIRAATRGYTYFSGWDGTFCARLLLFNNNLAAGRQFLNFINNRRGPNRSICPVWNADFTPYLGPQNYRAGRRHEIAGRRWEVCHDAWAALLLEQYFAQTHDANMLRAWGPNLRLIFKRICRNADRRGLVASCYVGPDYPRQAARPEKFKGATKFTTPLTGAADMAILYEGLRAVRRLAGPAGDPDLKRQAAVVTERIAAGFTETFFNRKAGWFYDCLDRDTRRRYFLPALWQIMALQGEGLFLNFSQLDALVSFLTRYLAHPKIGFKLVAAACAAKTPATMSHNHWQNFFAETMRLLRWNGDMATIRRLCRILRSDWRRYRLVHENLFDVSSGLFSRAHLWDSYGSWMSGLTASTWWRGLLAGRAGLEIHSAGLGYIPAADRGDLRIVRLPAGPTLCDVTLLGQGAWVDSITHDGMPLEYTWQPPNGMRRMRVIIRRGPRPPITPTLVCAYHARVWERRPVRNGPAWNLEGAGPIPVVMACTRPFRLRLGDGTLLDPIGRLAERAFTLFKVPMSGRVTMCAERSA